MNAELAQELDVFSERVLGLANRLLGLVAPADQRKRKGKEREILDGQDDVVDHFQSLVVDVMDQMLEKTDICLDDFTGKNKTPAIAINPPIPRVNKVVTSQVIKNAAHLPKPQLLFKRKPDNSDTPWRPTLSHKFNAKVPLGYVYTDVGDDGSLLSNHPYHYEITHLNYPSHMFVPCTPQRPSSIDTTRPTWVSTPSTFAAMLAKLQNAKEIAVDLEHHSYRSYAGFLCLMQISDRDEDWLIDLLDPVMREEVKALNEIFTNPNIVKVFHGADSDIVWLQQDFDIYVINLFDTFHASQLLEFPRHGLANLLSMYCDFTPDKRYQLADWRIRPLPADMLLYAQSDTHFLLFIYDELKNALLDKGQSASSSGSSQTSTPLMTESLRRSSETSLRLYSKDPYDTERGKGLGGWATLAKKWNKAWVEEPSWDSSSGGDPYVLQRELFKSVHAWRDRIAREEDESTPYVLANHHLFGIAEGLAEGNAGGNGTASTVDAPTLIKALGGERSVPPVVKRRLGELVELVRGVVRRVGAPASAAISSFPEIARKTQPVRKAEEDADVVMLDVEVRKLSDMELNVNPTVVNAKTSPTSRVVDIWGRGSIQTVVASHSSLFGPSRTTQGGTLNLSSTQQASAASESGLRYSTTFSSLLSSNPSKPFKPSPSSFTSTTSKTATVLEGFNAVVARIHRSLASAQVYAGGAVASTSSQGPGSSNAMQVATIVDGAEAGKEAEEVEPEIAYLPPSMRKSASEKTERDTIVVVGRNISRKRKRKDRDLEKEIGNDGRKEDAVNGDLRDEAVEDVEAGGKKKKKRSKSSDKEQTKVSATSPLPTKAGSTTKNKTKANKRKSGQDEDAQEEGGNNEDEQPFDFASVPNLLDDNPDLDDSTGGGRKKKKARKEKGAAPNFYGDFPAPPKAHSEVKTGNRALTFRK